VQASIAVDAFRRAGLTGPGPGRPRVSTWSTFTGAEGLSSGRILFVLTVVVLLLLVAEAFVCGRVGRDWVAIRGMDIAAETIGIRPLPPKTARAFEIDHGANHLKIAPFTLHISTDGDFGTVLRWAMRWQGGDDFRQKRCGGCTGLSVVSLQF